MDGTSKRPAAGVSTGIGRGYIIIPEGYDRKDFIDRCLRLEKVSIMVENGGGFMHNCYISKSAIQDIKFPLEGETLGSGVFYFIELYSNKAIVAGVISKQDESGLNEEEVYSIRKSKDGNFAILSVDGRGSINFDVIGISDAGEVNINIRNDNKTAALKVNVKGNVNVNAEGNVNVKTIGGDVTIDSEGDTIIKTTYLKVGDANEAMVRGNTLQDEINKTNEVLKVVVDTLKNGTVYAGDGGKMLQNYFATKLLDKQVGNFNEIISEQSFLE